MPIEDVIEQTEGVGVNLNPKDVSGKDIVMRIGELRSHGNYTLGVLLTAVEAALGDSKQAEALKAIVRREMFALMDRNQGELYEAVKMQRLGLQPKETHIDGQDGLM